MTTGDPTRFTLTREFDAEPDRVLRTLADEVAEAGAAPTREPGRLVFDWSGGGEPDAGGEAATASHATAETVTHGSGTTLTLAVTLPFSFMQEDPRIVDAERWWASALDRVRTALG